MGVVCYNFFDTDGCEPWTDDCWRTLEKSGDETQLTKDTLSWTTLDCLSKTNSTKWGPLEVCRVCFAFIEVVMVLPICLQPIFSFLLDRSSFSLAVGPILKQKLSFSANQKVTL